VVRKFAERSDVIPVLAEIFREHGFAGTGLSVIIDRTGLGKGRLYHFFLNGKEEMAKAILDDVAGGSRRTSSCPCVRAKTGCGDCPHVQGSRPFFQLGRRVCLIGTFALYDTRDRFAS